MDSKIKDKVKLPWAIRNEVRRVICQPLYWLLFIVKGVKWGRGWRILGAPLIQRYSGSSIQIGDRVILRSWVSSNPVAPYHPVFLSTRSAEAEIILGGDVGITGGSIIAAQRVEIGNRVLVGGNCLITDTDFHPLDKKERMQEPKKINSRPVMIGDDVFIGTQSIILKGSSIGTGSIIGAGSVVSGKIPANVVAAGNPAVVIRHLDQ
ncbi:MAG: acyltransferase [Anaerolineales bacterium]|nr:acyltransferase [Anaerolineales bacterium]